MESARATGHRYPFSVSEFDAETLALGMHREKDQRGFAMAVRGIQHFEQGHSAVHRQQPQKTGKFPVFRPVGQT